MVTRLAPNVSEDLMPEPQGWHVDRKIPLAIILALLVQTFSIVWWAARLDDRVNRLEARETMNLTLVERMARLEEKLVALKDAVERIRK